MLKHKSKPLNDQTRQVHATCHKKLHSQSWHNCHYQKHQAMRLLQTWRFTVLNGLLIQYDFFKTVLEIKLFVWASLPDIRLNVIN